MGVLWTAARNRETAIVRKGNQLYSVQNCICAGPIGARCQGTSDMVVLVFIVGISEDVCVFGEGQICLYNYKFDCDVGHPHQDDEFTGIAVGVRRWLADILHLRFW